MTPYERLEQLGLTLPGVTLARDEGETLWLVDQKSVRMIARHMVAGDDPLAPRVEGHELVLRLYGDQDAV